MKTYKEKINGLTRHSLSYFFKHKDDIGKIVSIKGYHITHKDGITRIRVAVHGEKGKIVLGGLSWSYCGEGSRGLQSIIDYAKFPIACTNQDCFGKWNWTRMRKLSRILLWELSHENFIIHWKKGINC